MVKVTDSLNHSSTLNHIRVLSTQPLKAGENLLEIETILPNGKIIQRTIRVIVDMDYRATVKENVALFDTSNIDYSELIPFRTKSNRTVQCTVCYESQRQTDNRS